MRRLSAVVLFAAVVLGLAGPTAAQPNQSRHGLFANVNCTATATVLVNEDTSGTGTLIYNNGTVTVYIGYDTSVTTSNGIPIASAASLSLPGYRGQFSCISTSGSQDLRYFRALK